MLILLSALIVGAAVAWVGMSIALELKAARAERAHDRTLQLLTAFTPGVVAAASDPRALLTWQPLAESARRLYPQEFAELDRAANGTFPFTREQLQNSHSRWTADWLAWEQAHDAEFKLRVAEAEGDQGEMGQAGHGGHAGLVGARLDAIEREKLDKYQRRYEEYVRVSKGLQSLIR